MGFYTVWDPSDMRMAWFVEENDARKYIMQKYKEAILNGHAREWVMKHEGDGNTPVVMFEPAKIGTNKR